MTEGIAVVRGRTSKKSFFISFLVGLLALGGLLVGFGANGVMADVPMSGIGQFNVSFAQMTGKGFHLYGSLYTDNNAAKPVFVNQIDDVTISGLVISKDVSFGPLGNYTVKITAGNGNTPVHITGLTQKAALIQGDAQFTNMDISEHNVDLSNPANASKEFTQGSDTITIKNGSLDTSYLFQQAVSLPGMKVEFVKK
jgi:hypothetical protein